MAIRLNLFVVFLMMWCAYYFTEVTNLEFSNVQCESLDKDIAVFEHCFLKSVNHSYKYVSIKVKILYPVTKANVRFGLYKRLNGYKPFLYNMSFDACRFLKSSNPNVVALFFFQQDIELKMPYHSLNNKVTEVLPFPEGNYTFEAH
ncbi:uncharacterized protein LOC120458417 isoform X2 [Drosophila santomea]|uniref:uncharacterized protein LOC120458417 isoform X2 n=1 Tax=Drosophila santomea TaxID=129105 RepID=UPI001953CFBE|nr:uncharacterized protein LOC120458417 isoform X2 [Drosophila santomea]